MRLSYVILSYRLEQPYSLLGVSVLLLRNLMCLSYRMSSSNCCESLSNSATASSYVHWCLLHYPMVLSNIQLYTCIGAILKINLLYSHVYQSYDRKYGISLLIFCRYVYLIR